MFSTPAGMKTLFPIFENTLRGKVLAVKTRTLSFEENETFNFYTNVFPNWNKSPDIVGKKHPDVFCMAISWLKGVVGGKLPVCFLFGCKFPPFFFPTLLQQHNFYMPRPLPCGGAWKDWPQLHLCWKKEIFARKLQMSFFQLIFCASSEFLIFRKHEF